MLNADTERKFVPPRAEDFLASSADSINDAIMENTTDAIVAPLDYGRHEIGSWSALWDVSNKDERAMLLWAM